jgi:hypothetical protein
MSQAQLISKINEKRQIARLLLKRLSPISSYQTRMTASVDTPPRTEL